MYSTTNLTEAAFCDSLSLTPYATATWRGDNQLITQPFSGTVQTKRIIQGGYAYLF
jgi:hypothetical protein